MEKGQRGFGAEDRTDIRQNWMVSRARGAVGSQSLYALKMCAAPCIQAVEALHRLLRIRTANLLQPVLEFLLFPFEQQEPSKHHVRLQQSRMDVTARISHVRVYAYRNVSRWMLYAWCKVRTGEVRSGHTKSYPFSFSLLPRVFPIPASSVTTFSPIGSAMKFLCFCEVVAISLFCGLKIVIYLW